MKVFYLEDELSKLGTDITEFISPATDYYQEMERPFDQEHAEGVFKAIHTKGFRLEYSRIRAKIPCRLCYSRKNQRLSPFVNVFFMLKGHCQTHSIIDGKERNISIDPERNNLWFSNVEVEVNGFMEPAVGEDIEVFEITFEKDYFVEMMQRYPYFFDRLKQKIDSEPYFLISPENLTSSPTMTAAIYELLNNNYEEGFKEVFTDLKVLEILLLQLEQAFTNYKKANQICRSPQDIKAIHQARELLIEDLSNPPSLRQLAKLAGINEFKLKNGFKQVYKEPVFQYLNHYRLDEAKRIMLDNRDLSMGEVAYEVGFKQASHFSSSFKARYGVSPKSWRSSLAAGEV